MDAKRNRAALIAGVGALALAAGAGALWLVKIRQAKKRLSQALNEALDRRLERSGWALGAESAHGPLDMAHAIKNPLSKGQSEAPSSPELDADHALAPESADLIYALEGARLGELLAGFPEPIDDWALRLEGYASRKILLEGPKGEEVWIYALMEKSARPKKRLIVAEGASGLLCAAFGAPGSKACAGAGPHWVKKAAMEMLG